MLMNISLFFKIYHVIVKYFFKLITKMLNNKTRLIAKLQVKSEHVVKPIFFEGLKKIGLPKEIAKQCYNKGLDEIIIIDIVSSLYQRKINHEQIKHLSKEVFIPIIYAGGIKNLNDISLCLSNGADKVGINTHAIKKKSNLIYRAAKEFGSQCIVVNIEAKKIHNDWYCYTNGGRINSGVKVTDWVVESQLQGAGEILIQSVDRDGYKDGPDFELFSKINSLVRVPLVLSSGFRKLIHFKTLKKMFKPDAVALSSSLHYKELSINKIRKVL